MSGATVLRVRRPLLIQEAPPMKRRALTKWLFRGLSGVSCEAGETGEDGEAGEAGVTGEAGISGVTDKSGEDGVAGEDG